MKIRKLLSFWESLLLSSVNSSMQHDSSCLYWINCNDLEKVSQFYLHGYQFNQLEVISLLSKNQIFENPHHPSHDIIWKGICNFIEKSESKKPLEKWWLKKFLSICDEMDYSIIKQLPLKTLLEKNFKGFETLQVFFEKTGVSAFSAISPKQFEKITLLIERKIDLQEKIIDKISKDFHNYGQPYATWESLGHVEQLQKIYKNNFETLKEIKDFWITHREQILDKNYKEQLLALSLKKTQIDYEILNEFITKGMHPALSDFEQEHLKQIKNIALKSKELLQKKDSLDIIQKIHIELLAQEKFPKILNNYLNVPAEKRNIVLEPYNMNANQILNSCLHSIQHMVEGLEQQTQLQNFENALSDLVILDKYLQEKKKHFKNN